MKIKNSALISISIFLVILYLLSFTKIFSPERRKVQKTALLNPKYKEAVTSINLSQKDQESLLLEKTGDLWTVRRENSNFSAPADSKRINDFLLLLSSIINVYKISDKQNGYPSFSFDFSLRLSYENTFSDIFFGKHDFSQTLRYFMTGKSAAVYQAGSQFDNFLTVSKSFWTEPYIISRQLNYADIQRITISDFESQSRQLLTPQNKSFKSYLSELLELRHAGLFSEEDSFQGQTNIEISVNPILKLELETGNKDQITITAYRISEENLRLSDNYKKADYTCDLKISSWTFLKLKQKALN